MKFILFIFLIFATSVLAGDIQRIDTTFGPSSIVWEDEDEDGVLRSFTIYDTIYYDTSRWYCEVNTVEKRGERVKHTYSMRGDREYDEWGEWWVIVDSGCSCPPAPPGTMLVRGQFIYESNPPMGDCNYYKVDTTFDTTWHRKVAIYLHPDTANVLMERIRD